MNLRPFDPGIILCLQLLSPFYIQENSAICAEGRQTYRPPMHIAKCFFFKPILCSLVYLRKQRVNLRFLFFSYSFTVRYRWKILLFAMSAPFLPHVSSFQRSTVNPVSPILSGSITASYPKKTAVPAVLGIFFQIKKTKLDAVRVFLLLFVFIKIRLPVHRWFLQNTVGDRLCDFLKIFIKDPVVFSVVDKPCFHQYCRHLVCGRQVPVFL